MSARRSPHRFSITSQRLVVLVTLATIAALFAAIGGPSPADAAESDIRIEVLSSPAEYVSGGDARIRVTTLDGASRLVVTANGADVTASLRQRGRSLEGVVGGLVEGDNVIAATGPGGSAEIVVTNHPITGPMWSGPHQTPFYCQTEAAGLGPALDEDCSADTRVQYLYRSTSGGFQPLPVDGSRPADLATTTTTRNKTVDYIVKLETGTINRAVYQTAILVDPRRDTTPGWNGRLVYSYGGGCNAAYAQGAGNGGVLSDMHLGLGYATASSSLNVLNNNCNDVLSAETTSMVKEHFIEAYGAPESTIGWGGSGGSISQYLIAHNYPGLLDGLIPSYNYPDASSIFSGIGDCRLLYDYFNQAPAGLWDFAAQSAVSGFHDWTNCLAWVFSFSNRIDATTACNPIVPPDTIYDPDTNPDGVRCTIADDQINVLGVDPVTGFAPSPAGNIGVQYGLTSLNDGSISIDQFIDVNTGIGGFDPDGLVTAGRVAATTAQQRYYETGRIITGGGLATMPIINFRPYLDALSDIHTRFYTFTVEARLLRDNGTADNQVIQIYPAGNGALQNEVGRQALLTMDEWLAGIGSDTLSRTAEEVIAARPATAVDTCWDAAGNAIVEPASWDGDTPCNDLYPSFGDPRIEAGAPLTDDILSCALRPLDPADYSVTFTDDQWSALEAAFPTGVCDYDVPGATQVPFLSPWQDYS